MYYPKQIPYLLDKEFKENIEYIKNILRKTEIFQNLSRKKGKL